MYSVLPSGSYHSLFSRMIKGFETLGEGSNTGSVVQADAQEKRYGKQCIISTDPPYYDNIGYADLSDFFFCWMKPLIRPVYPDLFGVLATPKSEELVATPYRHGGKETAESFFLDGMSKAIAKHGAADFA